MGSRKSDKPRARPGSGSSRPSRARATRREETYRPGASEPADAPGDVSAQEHYRREKARRGDARAKPNSDPLEEARREYRAMLEADAARQKGGRPRKTAARKAEPEEAVEVDVDDVDSIDDVADEVRADDEAAEGEKE